jgi:prepilin-type N-terminal cleavage/methylation domain-containing protein
MKSKFRKAFTLVEVLIVVVILAVLAATIIPQFSDSTKDAKESTLLFNLHTLRSQIQMYRTQHDGLMPDDQLQKLISATDRNGDIASDGQYGPYVTEIPENPFNKSKTIKVITNSPAVSSDVSTTDGWLYNATTGEIWISHADYFDK